MLVTRGLIGKKLGMTQIFDKDGNVIPVTVVQTGPCTVLSVIDAETKKVRLGFGAVKESRMTKPEMGFFKKLGVEPVKLIREFETYENPEYVKAPKKEESSSKEEVPAKEDSKAEEAKPEAKPEAEKPVEAAKADEAKAATKEVQAEAQEPVKEETKADEKAQANPEEKIEDKAETSEPTVDDTKINVGDKLKVNLFRPGDFVDVTGQSKGKGFQGGMKRWGWSGGPAGHGSMHHRRVGSIGASADPSRTFRGRHMPGHMGDARVTVQGLRVMAVDLENDLLLVDGAVPGGKNSYLMINLSRKKKYRSLDEVKAVHAVKRNPMKQSKSKAKGK